MHDRQLTPMERLLGRLLRTRARRDREVRYSDRWHAADAKMHEIERAIFQLPDQGYAGEGAAAPARGVRYEGRDMFEGERAG